MTFVIWNKKIEVYHRVVIFSTCEYGVQQIWGNKVR